MAPMIPDNPMPEVGVFYIGLPRFRHITEANHKKLLDRLQEKFVVHQYDLTQPILNREKCPWKHQDTANHMQVWDFYQGYKRIPQRYIIKLRTDDWFTDFAIEVVVNELTKIVDGEYHVAYMGMMMLGQDWYKELYGIYPYEDRQKVLDWVVMVDKAHIAPARQAYETLHSAKYQAINSGNYSWKALVNRGKTRARQIGCPIYLVRRDYDRTPTDYEVGAGMISRFRYDENIIQWWDSMAPDNKSIAIVYIGDRRYPEVGLPNHQPLIDQISELAYTNVYHFTKDWPGRGQCPWAEGGANQVWDFMESVGRTTESIVIKLRTDLWFTESSIAAVIAELKEVIAGNISAAFFGSNWTDYLGHKHTRVNADESPNVQDFVVIARRETIDNKDAVYDYINNSTGSKLACGTKVYKSVVKPNTSAVNVFCQIYLVRKTYDVVDPWQVGYDYIASYRKQWKMPDALPWYISTKPDNENSND